VDQLGVAREFGADLAHAVAEADRVVEALIAELAQVLGAPAAEVDAALPHHPHGVGVKRLGMATGALSLDGVARELLDERLGDLRPGAVARAEEQHPRAGGLRRSIPPARRRRGEAQGRMQGRAACRKQIATAREVERVVGVASVGRAAVARDNSLGSQPAEMVRDQALRPLDQPTQLANASVAARELAQQPPAERIGRQPQEAGRRLPVTGSSHDRHNTSI
jgi:hypothetical protein